MNPHCSHTQYVNIAAHVTRNNLRQSVGINNGLAFVQGKYMTVKEYESKYPEIPLQTWFEFTKGKNPDSKSLS